MNFLYFVLLCYLEFNCRELYLADEHFFVASNVGVTEYKLVVTELQRQQILKYCRF